MGREHRWRRRGEDHVDVGEHPLAVGDQRLLPVASQRSHPPSQLSRFLGGTGGGAKPREPSAPPDETIVRSTGPVAIPSREGRPLVVGNPQSRTLTAAELAAETLTGAAPDVVFDLVELGPAPGRFPPASDGERASVRAAAQREPKVVVYSARKKPQGCSSGTTCSPKSSIVFGVMGATITNLSRPLARNPGRELVGDLVPDADDGPLQVRQPARECCEGGTAATATGLTELTGLIPRWQRLRNVMLQLHLLGKANID
ncbi:hypothetical protein [Pseudonocardia sp.]|uniref:hypothetical protein n=1 Tax=Pseudonocardia sp. TaxID=60912 RepID=UPI0031FDF413